MIIFPFCFLILFLAAFSEQRIESLALRWQESVVLSFMFQVHKFFAINMVIPFFLCPVNIIPFSRLPLNHFPNSITSPFLVLVQAQFFTFSHCIRNRFFSFPALPKNRCSTLFDCAAFHSFVLTAWSPAAINTPPPYLHLLRLTPPQPFPWIKTSSACSQLLILGKSNLIFVNLLLP